MPRAPPTGRRSRSVDLSWLLLLTLAGPARADDRPVPALQAAMELQRAARLGAVQAAWLDRWVGDDPVTRARWAWALRPGGPVLEALAGPRHVLALTAGPDYHRVVFDGAPLLSLVVSDGETPRARTLEPTTCGPCSEPSRFVADLLAEVRHRGALGDRLIPVVELSLTEVLEQEPRAAADHWPSLLALRLGTDRGLAHRLAEATVVGENARGVLVRYANGLVDTWRVRWEGDRWAVVYADLAPDSPLRLEPADAKAWRTTSTRQRAMVQGWEPSWLPVAAAGTVVGHDASQAVFDPRDGTVWVLVDGADPAESAVFRVDPDLREVVSRHRLPLRSARANHRAGPWAERWRAVAHPAGGALLFTGPEGLWLLDGDEPRQLERRAELTAIAWAVGVDGARAAWADAEGHVRAPGPDGATRALTAPARPLALAVVGDRVEVATAAGQVLAWGPDDAEPSVVTEACDGAASAAAPHESGRWLVVCDRRARTAWEAVGPLPGPPETGGFRGVSGTIAAWSPDGERVVTAAPADLDETVVVWDVRTEQPLAVLGYREVRQATFSPDGALLLTVDAAGEVVVWDLAATQASTVTPEGALP